MNEIARDCEVRVWAGVDEGRQPAAVDVKHKVEVGRQRKP